MKIVALAGGVGGAKLVKGLAHCINPENLTVIVNTGDDFEHFGLKICPDLDTVCYSLAGIANPEKGWGREKESFYALDEIAKFGGPNWFKLGDKDLGTHLERTRRLKNGEKLSEITRFFCQCWGINVQVFPMTDETVSTILVTVEKGVLPFQEYFVKYQCEPRIKEIKFLGIEKAKPAPKIIEKIKDSDLVIICPSNPWVSIDPILSIKGIKEEISKKIAVAVSPIVKRKAIRGPAAKMFLEMGIQSSASAVADHYKEIIKGFILDNIDINEKDNINRWGIIFYATNTIMSDDDEKIHLASEIINFATNHLINL